MDYENELFWYDGLKDGGTFPVDETTAEAIKDNPDQLKGKVVTLTIGNYMVGYGSAGDDPLGYVRSVEPISGNKHNLCAAVVFNSSFMFVPADASAAPKSYGACDGKGGIQKAATPTSTRIWATGKDMDDNDVCTVYIHG